MGSGMSLDTKYGNIHIETLKNRYISGEQIDGFVHLNLIRDYPVNTLDLIITGEEKVQLVTVHRSSSKNGSRKYASYHRANREILSYKFPLYAPQGIFKQGQYSFPFSFKLPTNIPSSFSHQWLVEGYNAYAMISYRMWAGMQRKKNKALFSEHIIQIDQVGALSSGEQERMHDNKLKGCCGRDFGNFIMGCVLDKDSYLIGETANLTLFVDNTKCKTAIDRIKIKLIQKVTASLGEGRRTDVLNNAIVYLNFDGIEKGDTRMGENDIKCALPIQANTTLFSTSIGSIVRNEFYIEIKPVFKKCMCCGDHPKIVIDVKLYSQQFVNTEYPPHPVDWNPQVMNPYACTFSAETQLDLDTKKQLGII